MSVSPDPKRTSDFAPARNVDDTRGRLLDAAGYVFAEKGFRATKIRHICARAGAKVAAVNYPFGDKLKLHTEMLRHAMCLDAIRECPEILGATTTAERKLRFLVVRMLRSINDETRPSWVMVMHEMAQNPCWN